MTLKAEGKNTLLEDLKDVSTAIAKDSPSWLAQLRQNSFARFAELGIPTTRHEEWKYFNLSPINARRFKLPVSAELKDEKALREYFEDGEINIVFINGIFSEKFSNIKTLPKGVTVLTLAQALEKEQGMVSDFYKRSSSNDPEPFVSLNTALHSNGAFIRIAEKAIVGEVVHIFHVTTSNIPDTAVFPRTFIAVGKSSQVSIVETYVGLSDAAYFVNPVTDIQMSENSVLNYYKVQVDGAKALHIGAVRVWQEANTQLEAFSLAAGAQMARNNISVASDGEGSDSIVDGLYVLSGTQVIDNHTLIDHRKPNCTSHQLYKGILNDASHAVFNGKIFVRPIAQKTNSYQLNKHLVLGKDARVDTKPQLEISADDVKCTHGATIGQLNEDEVFYLQTRCISKEDAVKMLSRGFVDDILDKLRDQNVRRKLSKLLSKKIAILR